MICKRKLINLIKLINLGVIHCGIYSRFEHYFILTLRNYLAYWTENALENSVLISDSYNTLIKFLSFSNGRNPALFCNLIGCSGRQALSTRIRIRLYPQTFCCGFKSLRVHTYADSLRFRASTRIRENDTNTLDLPTEHALSHVMSPQCCW